MDVSDIDQDDTVGSADDVGTTVEPAEKAVGSQEYDADVWSKAPKKCPTTGKFLPGTGGSLKGGRPRNSRDKITTTMIRLAEETAAEHGEQMFRKLAQTDPAACLALITRLLPSSDLSSAIKGEAEDRDAIQQITISLVGKPTEQVLAAPQERLQAPVQRIEPSPDDLAMVVEEDVSEATEEPDVEVYSGPTEEELDAEAAELEQERIALRNEQIRQHDPGAHTGMPSREQRASGAGINYNDDSTI